MMERLGRRKLLIFGAVWMCICELIVAVVRYRRARQEPGRRQDRRRLCLHLHCRFRLDLGPCRLGCLRRDLPPCHRAKALSLCTASNWLWNFGIGYANPYLVDVGPGKAGLGPKVFFIWTGTCACCAVFAYLFIYETRLLSLEEVDEMYAKTPPSSRPPPTPRSALVARTSRVLSPRQGGRARHPRREEVLNCFSQHLSRFALDLWRTRL